MSRWKALTLIGFLVLCAPGLVSVGWAEEAATQAEPAPSQAVEKALEGGVASLSYEDENTYTVNTLIMFVCAVLVLFMQAGFAMVETGLNQAKNTINILFKNLMDLSVGVLLFLFIGFGLMYPGGDYEGGFFGFGGSMVGDDLAALSVEDVETALADEDAKGALRIMGEGADAKVIALGDYSSSADFLFQVAFAATAATIVSGAVAGRMKFPAYLIYSGILTGLIYPISGMWKWGGGFLNADGFQDFAGSVVVHAVGGFAGLAGAIILGARRGRFTKDGRSAPIPGHNITFAALGVFILWIGWYGFNPGSQLTYSGAGNAYATLYIALTTTLSAAAGAVAAMILAWVLFSKPDITMALNGALAGLVGITANCDRVSQPEALVIGGVAGVLVVLGIVMLEKLKIDDPVGAWPVHGLCGIWGGLATGFFGDIPEVNGALLTRGEFIWVQFYSTAIICAWAFFTMLVLFTILRAAGILRVSEEDEQKGLDLSEHGMQAYAHV